MDSAAAAQAFLTVTRGPPAPRSQVVRASSPAAARLEQGGLPSNLENMTPASPLNQRASHLRRHEHALGFTQSGARPAATLQHRCWVRARRSQETG